MPIVILLARNGTSGMDAAALASGGVQAPCLYVPVARNSWDVLLGAG